MIKKDSFILGIVIGLVLPVLFFFFLVLVNELIFMARGIDKAIRTEHMLLMSIFSNLVPIRYYFVNLKADKTGRSILFLTFISGILFFAFRTQLQNLL